MKTHPLGPPSGEFLPADLYARRRWRRAQYLAGQFWSRWRQEYLQSLQARNKWKHPKRNLANGDIVLMKEDGEHRNSWPMGRVVDAIQSKDGLVRKASITVSRDGKLKTMFRPIKELILLVPIEEQKTGKSDGELERTVIKRTHSHSDDDSRAAAIVQGSIAADLGNLSDTAFQTVGPSEGKEGNEEEEE
ncbi:hypothetical protein QZH41_001386 [Actinostola sp. cb2023]|nr:hypothetical protein QZH41_001386 [Actinostola sp. cb2023]